MKSKVPEKKPTKSHKKETGDTELKDRKLKAAAEKIELDNQLKKQKVNIQSKKIEAEAKIKIFKAEQEEIKTRVMSGDYIHVDTMKYYFSFFQRGISDCFAAVKKVSPQIKRLYKADKNREAEKIILEELHINFSNVIKALQEEMENGGANKD